ncbi:MAG: AMP-binding protein [Myxococcota bacterium]
MIAPRPSPSPDLIGLLAARAERQGDQLAYRFLADDGEPIQSARKDTLDYAQLHRWVDEIAGRLAPALLPPGSSAETARVILVFPPGLEFIAAFFACLHLGVTAVPLPPPGRRRLERLRWVIRDCEADALLAPESVARHLGDLLEDERATTGAAPTLVVSDAAAGGDAIAPRAATFDPDRTAFLQYTSGSTGIPRGVQVSCSNLGDNLSHICERFGHDEDSRGVIWLPPYHDMGLIGGLLQPLFVGFPVTLMAPGAFIRSPLRWLQAIDAFRATTSGGPNFAYEHCVTRVSDDERAALDLSCWRVAFNGAEAVSSVTLDRFADTFAETGFRRSAWLPCYGLAESTLMATGGHAGDGPTRSCVDREALTAGRVEVTNAPPGPTVLSRVASGVAVAGHDVRCVDPETRETVAADRIGEIWVRGPSVAQGYWRNEKATEETFGAVTAEGDGPFVRTGDLGFMQGGLLYVSGRRKDLIVLRGRNLFPSDLERAIEEAGGGAVTNATAAFAVESESGDRLVIAQEVPRRFEADRIDDRFALIRRAVVEGFEVAPDTIVLLKPGQLPMTPSGKVQRVACRDLFRADALGEVARWTRPDGNAADPVAAPASIETRPDADAREIEAFMRAWVGRRLGLDAAAIDPDRPMSELGLDSVGAVELATTLGAWLEREDEVSETLAWEHPTATEVVRFLTRPAPTRAPDGPPVAPDATTGAGEGDAADLLAAELERARRRRS